MPVWVIIALLEIISATRAPAAIGSADPIAAGARVAEMISRSAIITQTGKEIKTKIDTVCLHGDTPNAVNIAMFTALGVSP